MGVAGRELLCTVSTWCRVQEQISRRDLALDPASDNARECTEAWTPPLEFPSAFSAAETNRDEAAVWSYGTPVRSACSLELSTGVHVSHLLLLLGQPNA
jgi:hypothetical protein